MSALASIFGPMVAIVFGAAAVAKGRPAGHRELVTLLRKARLSPRAWAAPVAVLLVAAEAATAACLVFPATARIGSVAAGLLLAVLTAGLAVAVRRRTPLVCACFGAGGGPVGAAQLGRNLLLLAAAVANWVGAPDARPSLAGWAAAALAATLVIRFDDLHDLLVPAVPLRSRIR